ncbi:MAG: peptide deformylase [Patescibacteria group bacterium]
MSKKSEIITLPHPSLRTASRKVGLIDQEILDVVDTMITQTLAWEQAREHEVAVALAAVQIDKPWKIVVIREDFDDKSNQEFVVLINPEITKYGGKVNEVYQGCLSVKDYYVKVPRHSMVKIKALNIHGQEIRFKAEGFLAEVLQHEVDHIKGITIVDRATDEKSFKRLNGPSGKLEKVDYEEIIDAGILAD